MFKVKAVLNPRKIKKHEFQGVLVILLAVLLLTGVQTFQLYAMKNALAEQGLGAFDRGATNTNGAQSSDIPDQVGGCFRG